jgi:hypothetical protein
LKGVEILRDEPLLNMDLMQSFGVIYYIKEYILGSVTLRTGLPEGDGEMIGVSVGTMDRRWETKVYSKTQSTSQK